MKNGRHEHPYYALFRTRKNISIFCCKGQHLWCSEALLHLRLHFSTFVAFNKAALLGKLKAVLL